VVNLCIHFGIPQDSSKVKKKTVKLETKVAQIFKNNEKKNAMIEV